MAQMIKDPVINSRFLCIDPWVKSYMCVIYRVGCTPGSKVHYMYIILKVKARLIRCAMLSGCKPVQVPCIHPNLGEGCVKRFSIPNL